MAISFIKDFSSGVRADPGYGAIHSHKYATVCDLCSNRRLCGYVPKYVKYLIEWVVGLLSTTPTRESSAPLTSPVGTEAEIPYLNMGSHQASMVDFGSPVTEFGSGCVRESDEEALCPL